MNFIGAQKPGFTPVPFRRHPGIQTQKNPRSEREPHQNDLHPEAGVSLSQSSQALGPKRGLLQKPCGKL